MNRLKSIFKTFPRNKKNIEQYYLRKMTSMYSGNFKFALIVSISMTIIGEIMSYMNARNNSSGGSNSSISLGRIFVLYIYSILTNQRFVKKNPSAVKTILMVSIIADFVLDFMEVVLVTKNTPHSGLDTSEHLSHFTHHTIINVQLLHISGVYILKEVIFPEVLIMGASIYLIAVSSPRYKLYLCFNFAISIFFNLFEFYFEQKRETKSFDSLMFVDKQSTNLAQFINRLLPLHIQDIINSGMKTGEEYQNVTLLFADIVGFTAYSAGKRPRQVVEMLSRLFTNFDKECDRLKLFKIYTIGDCYVVMGFVDSNNRRTPKEEAHNVAQLAISMINIILNVRKKVKFDKLDMRIGIHTGSAYGGVIGTDLVRFDLYGEDVVVANKMESGGAPGKICVSQTTKSLLESVETANYTFTEHQEVSLKYSDKKMKSYFMNIDNYLKSKDDNEIQEGEG